MSTVQTVALTDLIGLPWVVGSQGPDAYDSWGLFVTTQRTLFQRAL